MTFFKDEFIIFNDSSNNIYMFQWQDRCINTYFFDFLTKNMNKKIIVKNSLKEYDVSVDKDNIVYIVYQDINYNLILLILKNDEIKKIKLTEESIPLVNNLNIINYNKTLHIIYCTREIGKKNIYQIYHHFYDGVDWYIYKVKKIKVERLLNPFQIIRGDNRIFITYYDCIEEEDIYLKSFDCNKKVWQKMHRLTKGGKFKLYLDTLIINNKINLVYSQEYEGNFIIKYERYILDNDILKKDKEEAISNSANCSHPIIIFYYGKIWIMWIEYDNVLSRFSEDFGDTWSSIYLWNESKKKNIIRYKYIKNNENNNRVLNNFFGTVYPKVFFIGFGPLNNVTKISLK